MAPSVSVFLLVIGSSGCLHCKDYVCRSRLTITVLEAEDAALAPGAWSFELVVDEGDPKRATCTVADDSRSVRCERYGLPISPLVVDHRDNPYTRFQIDFEGRDGVDELPAIVAIEVLHDGRVVFDEVVQPNYELVEPERCDPDCFAETITAVAQR
jgi:hypothetical protein